MHSALKENNLSNFIFFDKNLVYNIFFVGSYCKMTIELHFSQTKLPKIDEKNPSKIISF